MGNVGRDSVELKWMSVSCFSLKNSFWHGRIRKHAAGRLSVVLLLHCRCLAAEQTLTRKWVIFEDCDQAMIWNRKCKWRYMESWSQIELSDSGKGWYDHVWLWRIEVRDHWIHNVVCTMNKTISMWSMPHLYSTWQRDGCAKAYLSEWDQMQCGPLSQGNDDKLVPNPRFGKNQC